MSDRPSTRKQVAFDRIVGSRIPSEVLEMIALISVLNAVAELVEARKGQCPESLSCLFGGLHPRDVLAALSLSQRPAGQSLEERASALLGELGNDEFRNEGSMTSGQWLRMRALCSDGETPALWNEAASGGVERVEAVSAALSGKRLSSVSYLELAELGQELEEWALTQAAGHFPTHHDEGTKDPGDVEEQEDDSEILDVLRKRLEEAEARLGQIKDDIEARIAQLTRVPSSDHFHSDDEAWIDASVKSAIERLRRHPSIAEAEEQCREIQRQIDARMSVEQTERVVHALHAVEAPKPLELSPTSRLGLAGFQDAIQRACLRHVEHGAGEPVRELALRPVSQHAIDEAAWEFGASAPTVVEHSAAIVSSVQVLRRVISAQLLCLIPERFVRLSKFDYRRARKIRPSDVDVVFSALFSLAPTSVPSGSKEAPVVPAIDLTKLAAIDREISMALWWSTSLPVVVRALGTSATFGRDSRTFLSVPDAGVLQPVSQAMFRTVLRSPRTALQSAVLAFIRDTLVPESNTVSTVGEASASLRRSVQPPPPESVAVEEEDDPAPEEDVLQPEPEQEDVLVWDASKLQGPPMDVAPLHHSPERSACVMPGDQLCTPS
jgi:hypothetical protein